MGMGVAKYDVIIGEVSTKSQPDDFHMQSWGPCEVQDKS